MEADRAHNLQTSRSRHGKKPRQASMLARKHRKHRPIASVPSPIRERGLQHRFESLLGAVLTNDMNSCPLTSILQRLYRWGGFMLYARFIPAGNGTSQPSTFDDSKKARLQLARARRDLRELWLERDELAVMASQAMQVTYGYRSYAFQQHLFRAFGMHFIALYRHLISLSFSLLRPRATDARG